VSRIFVAIKLEPSYQTVVFYFISKKRILSSLDIMIYGQKLKQSATESTLFGDFVLFWCNMQE